MSSLRAPFAGIVVSVPVDVGEIATMAPATTLVRLLDISELEIRVRVPERDLPGIGVGDAVVAHFPSLNTQAKGRVEQVSVEIDPKTRTAEVVARVPNQDLGLRAGLFTVLQINPKKQRSALVVPQSSIGGTAEQAFLYLVQDGQARRQAVKVEPIDDRRVEVTDGLEPGAVIVAGELDRIGDGALLAVGASDQGGKETTR